MLLTAISRVWGSSVGGGHWASGDQQIRIAMPGSLSTVDVPTIREMAIVDMAIHMTLQ